MSSWLLREATEAEAATVAALIRAAFEEYRGQLDPPSGAHNETAETVREKMKTARAVLALVGETAVGCVLYEVGSDFVYFSRLAVLPEHRHRGLGRALMDYVEARCWEWKRPRLTLGVRVALAEQRATYERLGFRPVETRTHEGYAEPTYLMMEKEIPT
jgi:GNAT superfamily N-acetyltransferase